MDKKCLFCGNALKRKIWYGNRKRVEDAKRFNERKFCDNVCRSHQLSKDNIGDKNYFYGKHLKPWNYKKEIRWRVKSSSGYIKIFKRKESGEDYFVYEHREVMEGVLGRKLKSDEIIHHINENKSDNRVENLMVVDFKEHRKIHSKQGKINAIY